MDDGSALLAAIALHPDEDVPRLAYADWLDEHHSPIRAEFIRIQCEIARIEATGPENSRRYVELYRRQDTLLTHHRRDLLGPLGDEFTDVEMHRDVRFDRGFLKDLRLDVKRFVKHADQVTQFKPLPDVTVFGVPPLYSTLRGLSNETLTLVTSLELELPELGAFITGGLEAPPMFPVFPRVWLLHADHCGMADLDLAEIVIGDQFPALSELSVAGNEITDDGVASLVQSPLWPRLHELVLNENPISDEGAETLANAPPTKLRFLHVRRTAIGQRGQQLLLRRKGWNVALF